jgi:hypothetical protein
MDEITLKVGSRIRGEVDGKPVDITITRITSLFAVGTQGTTTAHDGKITIAGESPEPRSGQWAQDASGEPTVLRAGSAITVTDPA